MLDAEDIRVVEVQEIRRPAIGIQILLVQLEAHALRVIIGLKLVIHRAGEA